MNGLRIPVFEKGNIVTAEMLEAVKDLPLDYQTIRYAGYSNGILTGCKASVNDGEILVGKGIIVFEEKLYYITEPLSVMYQASNEWCILQVVIGNKTSYRNVEEQELEAVLTSEAEKRADAVEVCRFRLQAGAVLRGNYRNFQDQETEYDTINEIYAEWSSFQESTVSARLLTSFADELGKKPLEPIDFMMCQQIYQMNGQSLNRKALIMYLNQRLQLKKEHYSNKEIYQKLTDILRIQQGRGPRMMERPQRASRIIVD